MDRPEDTIELRELAGPDDLGKARKQRQQFDRNSAWLQNHITEIYARHRGKCICIAGQQAFVADSTQAAIAQAMAAHPDDEGWFTRYIPMQKVARIYAL